MALRVLLADESTTIKKVFQLALQDFAVDVQTVNLGVDVMSVAEKFQPDIIFADVLLQKKSGYEVSSAMKSHPEMSSIPIVLMWSSFMDIDEDKLQASKADDRLEKPFDVKALRKTVEKFVPKTKDQRLSKYLSFPKLPEFADSGAEKKKAYNADDMIAAHESPPPEKKSTASPKDPKSRERDWSMDNFDPPEIPESDDFQEMNLKASQSSSKEDPIADTDRDLISEDSESSEDSNWQQKELSKYSVSPSDPEAEGYETSEPSIDYLISDDKVDADKILAGSSADTDGSDDLEIEEEDVGHSLPSNIESDDNAYSPEQHTNSQASIPNSRTVVLNFDIDTGTNLNSGSGTQLKQMSAELNEQAIQKVIETQAREIIEAAVWKILPDLATQIIERELKKLLDDHDRQSPRT